MYRAILWKEFKLLIASYTLTFAINFFLYGVFLGVFFLSAKGLQVMSFPKELDPFTIFCTFSIGISSMFLVMTAPTSVAEKSLGLLDNMLAYIGSARTIFISKAVFLWATVFMSFLFWSLVGLVASLLTSVRFVDRAFFARDVVIALVLYPLLLFCLALVQVFFNYVFPHIASLVNLLLFGMMFLVFSYLAQIAGKLMVANILMLGYVCLFLGGVIALLLALMGRLPSEVVLRSR
jgi:hypothetical protein